MTLDDFLTYCGLLLITAGSLYGLSREIADHAGAAATIALAVLQ